MYSESITRRTRTLFVIAIDQSGSMAAETKIGTRITTKAEMVSEVANDLIAELIERARRGDGVRDYYDVAVVGYSEDGVNFLLSDKWVSITELDKKCIDEYDVDREYLFENGERRILRHHIRRWITPKASGSTPMYEALLTINDLVKEWCEISENRNSFPPIISNITDGESTDCDYDDIAEIASKIKSNSTRDGNALLVNIHISSNSSTKPILFPTLAEMAAWSDSPRSALSLYNAASDLPLNFAASLREIKDSETQGPFKAMSYNSSVTELITLLNIGSISIKRG